MEEIVALERQDPDELEVIRPEEPEDIEGMIARIEKNEQAFQKILDISMRSTTPLDWVDQDGTPYLMGSGAEKIALRFGPRIKLDEYDNGERWKKIWADDGQGGRYYIYVVSGTISHPKLGQLHIIGRCSQRDKFFAKKGGMLKPVSEVPEEHIMMKAMTNFYANVIKRFFGLRNIPWDSLAKYGINKDNCAKIKYSKSEKAEKQSFLEKGVAPESSNGELDVESLKRIIKNKLIAMYGEKNWIAQLGKISSYVSKKDGKEYRANSLNINPKWIQIIKANVDKAFIEWQKAQGNISDERAKPPEETTAPPDFF